MCDLQAGQEAVRHFLPGPVQGLVRRKDAQRGAGGQDDLSLVPLDEVGDVTVWQTTAPDEVAARVREADTVIINKIRLNESNLSGSRAAMV